MVQKPRVERQKAVLSSQRHWTARVGAHCLCLGMGHCVASSDTRAGGAMREATWPRPIRSSQDNRMHVLPAASPCHPVPPLTPAQSAPLLRPLAAASSISVPTSRVEPSADASSQSHCCHCSPNTGWKTDCRNCLFTRPCRGVRNRNLAFSPCVNTNYKLSGFCIWKTPHCA